MKTRREIAQELRHSASHIAYIREHPKHCSNGEEYKFRQIKQGDCPKDEGPTHLTNFTKGLPHREDGSLVDSDHYQKFVIGIQSGNPDDFEKTPLGPVKLRDVDKSEEAYKYMEHLPDRNKRDCRCKETKQTEIVQTSNKKEAKDDTKCVCEKYTYLTDELRDYCPNAREYWYSQIAKEAENKKGAKVRAWESAGAGIVFDLQGPDAQAVTMPPAPKLDSIELAAEISEVYAMSLLRDTHFKHFRTVGKKPQATKDHLLNIKCHPSYTVQKAETMLKKFSGDVKRLQGVDAQTIFRGMSAGDQEGPYISQFMLIGNTGINKGDNAHTIEEGFAAYGPIHANQRVRVAEPCKDYMTTYEAWLDVQNGADVRGKEDYLDKPKYRFITTPRDLATYVHYDALYEAYLNACLIMLGMGIPFDRGIPFQAADNVDRQQGFAHFGGPHILSLVTEVATRALKAVRYQKFNVHRRARPEAFGGLIDCYKTSDKKPAYGDYLAPIEPLINHLKPVKREEGESQEADLLERVAQHNKKQNEHDDRTEDATGKKKRYLLPMAFPEGSPMHPSYGAGHATVAGACVTILKAYFDHAAILKLAHSAACGYHIAKDEHGYFAYEADDSGQGLVEVHIDKPLTVEGELNKLAANISIGRNWAGVHYYSDYSESLLMGEKIAIGILEEQKLTYSENFTMTVPLFQGGTVRI